MPGFERKATIDRPPAQVFAVLDDVRGARAWMPAIRRIEVVTPDNAVDVGYKWRETRAVMGILRITMPVEIVQHEPSRLWGIRVDDGKVRATATFTLTAAGKGATDVVLREDVEDLRGSPKRAARMARMMEKSDDDLLARLKAHVESRPAPVPADVKPTAKRSRKPATPTKKAR